MSSRMWCFRFCLLYLNFYVVAPGWVAEDLDKIQIFSGAITDNYFDGCEMMVRDTR